jgi:spore coat protein CotH
MKAIVFLIMSVFLVSCGAIVRPAGKTIMKLGAEYVFDLKSLPEIEIQVDIGEWNKLLEYFSANKENEEYIKADFIFIKDGKKEVLMNVGFRLRGNAFSRISPQAGSVYKPGDTKWQQSHFRVDFNEYVKGQSFHTLKALNLKAFNGDPAFVREIYCFDLFQRFGVLIAPRSSYVRLTIYIKGDPSPAYFGIYRMNESIDTTMMRDRFPGEPEGYLWKCLYPANLIHAAMEGSIGMEKISAESKHLSETYPYDLKTKKNEFEKAKQQLLDFAYNLNYLEGNKLKEWLEQNFDVQLFLKAYAVNVMVGMWDDYWVNNNNYYLYQHSSGKWYFIPYDYDNTLGTFIGSINATRDVFDWGGGGLGWGGGSPERPLIDKIFSFPEYCRDYSNYIAMLIDPSKELFDAKASILRIKEWHEMISPYIENDTVSVQTIKDRPADWGNCHYYRLLTGENDLPAKEVNYFLQRILYAKDQLNLIP